MIRNIVFDIGGVLMRFDTRALTAAFAADEADARLLYREFFEGTDWIGVDRCGDEREALARIQSRLPERLRQGAAQLMAQWDRFLDPIGEMNALGEELADKGYALYILSNVSPRVHTFRERIPLWPRVRGAVISSEERLLKPDPAIYRRLYERFRLVPEECVFIDDSNANIEAARWTGMHGCLYRGEIGPVRDELRRLGVPAASGPERREA